MFTRAKYCAVCGCLFGLPDICNPALLGPDEDEEWAMSYAYDARVLPKELANWLTDFRVVGRWQSPSSLIQNVSSIPDFFISPPATWQYGYTFEPNLPTTDGKEERLSVYESTDAGNGMLFPIHQACLDLVDRMCQIRKEQCQVGSISRPQTLEEVCDCLESQRSANMDDNRVLMGEPYYGRLGGIEWPHQYFGARQFWLGEWDASPGWELLCTDPAATKIPRLSSFILSELPQQSSSLQTPADHEMEWLFPQELEAARLLDEGGHDWIGGVRLLNVKANSEDYIQGGAAGKEEPMSLVPLGLRNRWRIWRVLEHLGAHEG